MRWLKEEIATVVNGRDSSGSKLLQQIRNNMDIRAHDELQGDTPLRQLISEIRYSPDDIVRIILIHSRKDMWCAGHVGDSVIHGDPRHFQRDAKIRSTIIQRRQDMGVQVNHTYNQTPNRSPPPTGSLKPPNTKKGSAEDSVSNP